MPVVNFTSNLKQFYPSLTTFTSNRSNILDILLEINDKYPGISDYIIDEQQQLRQHVNIFIDNEMIEKRNTLTNSVKSNSEIYVMQALSGG